MKFFVNRTISILPERVQREIYSNQDLVKDFSWRSFQTISKQGVLTLILFISARFLIPEEFGLLNYYIAALSLIVLFCNFGFSTATTRYVAQYNEIDNAKRDQVLTSSLIFIVFTVSVAIFFLFLTDMSFLGIEKSIFTLFIPYLFLVPISNIFDGYFRGVKKFKVLSLASAIGGAISLIIAILLITKLSLKGAILAQSIVYLMVVLFLLPYIEGIEFKFNKKVVIQVLRYSLLLGFVNLSYFLYSRADIFVLKYFGYVVEIGQYELINRVFQLILTPSVLLGQVMGPDISKWVGLRNWDKIRQKLRKYFYIMIVSGIAIVVILLFIGSITMRYILPTYLTEQFTLIAILMLILFPLRWWGVLLTNGFIAPSGFAKISFVTTFFGGVINILLDIILIRELGFIGVFVGTLIVHSITIIGAMLWFIRKLNRQRLN